MILQEPSSAVPSNYLLANQSRVDWSESNTKATAKFQKTCSQWGFTLTTEITILRSNWYMIWWHSFLKQRSLYLSPCKSPAVRGSLVVQNKQSMGKLSGRSWRAHSHGEDAGVREAFTLLLAVRKQDSNSPKQIHDMSNMLHHNIKECTSITWSALAYSMTYLNKIR